MYLGPWDLKHHPLYRCRTINTTLPKNYIQCLMYIFIPCIYLDKASSKHQVISNDDLLYDPDIDNENQRWVDQKRRRYQPENKSTSTLQSPINIDNLSKPQRPKPLPHSDAVLNCPACMTVLCLDCQRLIFKYLSNCILRTNVCTGDTMV